MRYSNDDPVFEAVATVTDPGRDGCADLGARYRVDGLTRAEAVRQARQFAAYGYHASVYAPDGEAVFELAGE